jgi:transforming growth factor-beta-induced protein
MKISMRFLAWMKVVVVSMGGLGACGETDTSNEAPARQAGTQTGNGEENPQVVTRTTIVDAARAAGNFTVLLGALQSTGLEQTLKGEGPFTVFAPTDAAFALLPQGVVGSLDQATLTKILTYHVHAGNARAAEVVGSAALTTVEGQNISVYVQGSTVYLNGFASVVQTDITTDNGVIHVIDAVLLPPSVSFPGSVVDALVASPSFSTLVGAVGRASLVDALKNSNNGNGFTVFAPTNAAFQALGVDLSTLTADQLTNILLYHVIGSKVPASQVVSLNTAAPLGGGAISIALSNGKVVLNDKAHVIRTDLNTNNGVIHVIDAVLLP